MKSVATVNDTETPTPKQMFTTGHFFQRLNCNIESNRNRDAFMQQIVKQSQPQLEETEVTAVAPMDQVDPAVLHTECPQIHDPDVGEARRHQQA